MLLFVLCSLSARAQLSRFKQLSKPEKVWVLKHPFIAQKAFRITSQVITVCKSNEIKSQLDSFPSGGKLDAFRHIFWMASLTKYIGPKRAITLGIAHEKGNYLQFLSNQIEDSELSDAAASRMDSLNNLIGIGYGLKWRSKNENPNQQEIIKCIGDGACYVLKRNKRGSFLTCDEKEILKVSRKAWHSNRCVILLADDKTK
jgi:hypothetical protein